MALQNASQTASATAGGPTVTTTPPALTPGPNAAAAQQAQSILAAVQAHQALHQQQRMNPFMPPVSTAANPVDYPGAKASAQQAITAAEKMYRDALQARSAAAAAAASTTTNPSDLLKHLNMLRGAQK